MSLTASTVHRGNSLSQMVELTSARLLREFGLHSPQHGGVGITSQVTYVTMVPRVGNETLRPLGFGPCFRTQALDEEEDDVFSRRSFYYGSAGSDVIGCRRPMDVFFFICIFRHESR